MYKVTVYIRFYIITNITLLWQNIHRYQINLGKCLLWSTRLLLESANSGERFMIEYWIWIATVIGIYERSLSVIQYRSMVRDSAQYVENRTHTYAIYNKFGLSFVWKYIKFVKHCRIGRDYLNTTEVNQQSLGYKRLKTKPNHVLNISKCGAPFIGICWITFYI